MRRFLFAALLALTSVPAAAATAGVMSTVHQFVDNLNKGDLKTALAACASPASIIDEFSPHEWQGSTACAEWLRAYNADARRRGITDTLVTLGTPWHVDVAGNRAYVVVPANYSYKQDGKPVMESGSIFTVALRKAGNDWRITGWAWAKH
jgi:ketosteroid isomerase-like protein